MNHDGRQPMRHCLPTLPCDLREYARIHTGPESWSRSDDLREVLTEPDAMRTFLDGEPLASVVDEPLIDVRRCDVPRKTPSAAHGGRLDVTSKPGAGSTFTLTLPMGGVP